MITLISSSADLLGSRPHYFKNRGGLSPSHGGNAGSNPAGVTSARFPRFTRGAGFFLMVRRYAFHPIAVASRRRPFPSSTLNARGSVIAAE